MAIMMSRLKNLLSWSLLRRLEQAFSHLTWAFHYRAAYKVSCGSQILDPPLAGWRKALQILPWKSAGLAASWQNNWLLHVTLGRYCKNCMPAGNEVDRLWNKGCWLEEHILPERYARCRCHHCRSSSGQKSWQQGWISEHIIFINLKSNIPVSFKESHSWRNIHGDLQVVRLKILLLRWRNAWGFLVWP